LTIIQDPVTGEALRVTSANRGQVEAEASARQFFISRDDEQVYHVISEDATAIANEEILYLQNTSTTKRMFLGNLVVSSDIDIIFRVKQVTGTAVGTDLTPKNLNLTSTNLAEANAKGNGGVTGLSDDGDIFVCRSLAGSSRLVSFFDTVVLGQNQAIAVELETSAAVEITMDFHFET